MAWEHLFDGVDLDGLRAYLRRVAEETSSAPKLRNALMLARTFPPNGGSGVQRTLKFTRYLPPHGWRPIVVTSGALPDIFPQDPSLLEQVSEQAVVIRCAETTERSLAGLRYAPFRAFGRALGAVRSAWGSLPLRALNRAVASSRGWPLWGWVRTAVAAAREVLDHLPCDVIYSTSYPLAAHQVAGTVTKESGIPWVADFRDPFVGDRAWFTRTRKQKRRMLALERKAVTAAARVVNVHASATDHMAQRYSSVPRERFRTILNGYDPEDLQVPGPPAASNGLLTLAHAGMLYQDRDATGLFDALRQLRAGGHEAGNAVRVDLYGMVESQLADVAKAGLTETVRFHDYVPHNRLHRLLSAADVMLLVVAPVPGPVLTVPGKLYEYMGLGKPVLVLGPADCPAAQIIRQSGTGLMVENRDVDGICRAVETLWEAKKAGTIRESWRSDQLQPYQRQHQAAELAALFQEIAAPG
jgi:glycosyltransferase involved in cell wall biosynthesis